MQTFQCDCGQPLFFDNDHCEHCGAELGFDPETLSLYSLTALPQHKRCANHDSFVQCNWLLPTDDAETLCESCRLTKTLPQINPENELRLVRLEAAKRRWLYGIRRLGLPVLSFHQQPEGGLAFDFLEDQAGNPEAEHEHVLTGHNNGLITLNIAEADPVERALARELMNEQYRTLVGHFRHESGHFYWDQLVWDSKYLAAFRLLFGDEQEDYAEALERHYAKTETQDWREDFVSSYASSHPWEDWAETWAHYLHLTETLETASSFGLCEDWHALMEDFDALLATWFKVSVTLNELNRSMGQNDSYPFVLQPTVVEKLKFVHHLVERQQNHEQDA